MKAQVFSDKAGDEVVAVVVVFLHAQSNREIISCPAGVNQGFGVELFSQKFVTGALVDE